MNTRLPFQLNLPTYVKIPFTGRGRQFKRGDLFDWKALNIPEARVLHMFSQGYLHQPPAVPQKTSLDVFKEEHRSIPMLELQRLAKAEGAETTNSKERQLELLFEHRQRVAAEDAALMARDRVSEVELEKRLQERRADAEEGESFP
jgi:hypothetical protein